MRALLKFDRFMFDLQKPWHIDLQKPSDIVWLSLWVYGSILEVTSHGLQLWFKGNSGLKILISSVFGWFWWTKRTEKKVCVHKLKVYSKIAISSFCQMIESYCKNTHIKFQ